MWKIFLLLPLLTACLTGPAQAILISNPNGAPVATTLTLAQLKTAPQAVGRTVIVDSALSASFSNISTASGAKWPANVGLRFEGKGSLANTTKFDFNGMPLDAGLKRVFTGTGRILGLPEARPENFSENTTPGTTDMTAAINKAVAATTPTPRPDNGLIDALINHGNRPLTMKSVHFQPGVRYALSGKVKLYSGQRFAGKGAVLTTLAGYPDPMMIELQFAAIYLTNQFSEVSGLTFEAPAGSGIAAVMPQQGVTPGATGLSVDNLKVLNIVLNCPKGVILTDYDGSSRNNVYTQALDVNDIYSFGPLEQMLKYAGNTNTIRKLDWELLSGSSTDPVIHSTTYYQSAFGGPVFGGQGNDFSDLILEGDGSANKTVIKVEKANNFNFKDTWIETAAQENAIYLDSCSNISFKGNLRLPASAKIKLVKSQLVQFEQLRENSGSLYWVTNRFDMDTYSTVIIDKVIFEISILNAFPILPNLTINRYFDKLTFDKILAADASNLGLGTDAITSLPGSSMLLNSDWSSNGSNWTWDSGGSTPTVAEWISSDVHSGKMAHFQWNSPLSVMYLYQNVTVPAAWVGRSISFSMPVRLNGVGSIEVVPAGIGLGGDGIYANVHKAYNVPTAAYTGWQTIRFNFVPQSAGTMQLKLFFESFTAATHAYLGAVKMKLAGTDY